MKKFDERTKGLAQSVTHRVALETFALGFVSMALVCFGFSANAGPADARAEPAPIKKAASIPWSQLGAKAGADYRGDGLAVVPTAEGARLRCVFQRLEGKATRDGLWLSSTASNTVNDRFRIVTAAIERQSIAGDEVTGRASISEPESEPHAGFYKKLAGEGRVTIEGQTVRFIRPGLTEEYSVSMDGVRQDFVLPERPGGAGELAVRLAVSGATIEPAPEGAQLVLENSGRTIAYNRLRVTDANGKELPARMEVQQTSASSPQPPAFPLVVLVDDTDAMYPVRIDPTFSDANWISMNPSIPGTDSQVSAAVVDGAGNLYIGGSFTVAGDVPANRIAKWNGTSWSALGSGVDGLSVNALAASGSDVYAGGSFMTADGIAAMNIAKWNGTNWSALGSGANGSVYALAASGSDLYVGGFFTTADGNSVNHIAKWDGNSWSALGSGVNDLVFALAVAGSDLYAGGPFTTATNSGGVAVTAKQIARWDGIAWSALGSGMGPRFSSPPSVTALAVSGTNLYAGGNFITVTNSGGAAVTVNHIARWNGSSWSALGSGIGALGARVSALAVSGDDLYASGNFTTAGGTPANGIAKWNGSSWSALGSGGLGVSALAVSGSDLYAGGGFTTAGGATAYRIAKWDGSSWSALGSALVLGMDGTVNALAVSGSDLYAGGGFTTVGGIPANGIVKWNGSTWSALGSGVFASALATAGSDLYAGGSLTVGGGIPVSYISKWNGSNWSTLGSGMARSDGNTPLVQALAVAGSDLYAGGFFTTAGGVPATNIAKWNGSSWTALGSGTGSQVWALAVSGGDVYAGIGSVLKWNGSDWILLGGGIGTTNTGLPSVQALLVAGGDLYAGGFFTTAGGSPAANIAKWNGSSWSALGSGVNGTVYALAFAGNALYVGGEGGVGGSVSRFIAKWDGTNWSTLGSGVNGLVHALAISGNDLYVGGSFGTAGGKVSPYLARAYLEQPVLSLVPSAANLTLSWPTFYESFVLQQNPDVTNPNTWSPANYPLTTNGATKSATAPLTPTNQFFRLIGN
jgi:hypothetical protein